MCVEGQASRGDPARCDQSLGADLGFSIRALFRITGDLPSSSVQNEIAKRSRTCCCFTRLKGRNQAEQMCTATMEGVCGCPKEL